MNLNQGQKDADEAFFKFLLSTQKEFIISGPAGVGKTFLMQHIINNTMIRYMETCKMLGIRPEYTNVVMTATTNKAADVLSAATGRPAVTIHSFLNLIVKEDYSNGTMRLTRSNTWVVHENLIIFIDECSMIDKNLYRAIQEGTQNCKLVYVGDHNQLSPVAEKLSLVYSQNAPMFELTEQMRNSGQPALMDICAQLRETVETGIFKPIKIVPGVIDIVPDDEAEAALEYVFKEPTTSSRILAYSNKRVNDFNHYIRTGVRKLPNTLTKGEMLVCNTAYKTTNSIIPVEATLIVREVGASFPPYYVEADTPLHYQNITVENMFGNVYSNIKVPVDHDHFNSLIKYYTRLKRWDMYFDLKKMFADFRPFDAATVHKSQGSTYDMVFVDLNNISACRKPEEAARLLYVAFSRAKSRVLLFGPLAPKFGGLI